MIESITPREAKRLVDEEGYRYVDVRSVPEFEQGHPEGAVNIPIAHMGPAGMEPNPNFLDVVRANFEPDAKLVLGCRSGVRSMRAAELLEGAGYATLVNMDGGFEGRRSPWGMVAQAGWADEGLPVSKTPAEGASYDALAEKAK